MDKLLVIGVGLLGSKIVELGKKYFDVYGTYCSSKINRENFYHLDKTNREEVFRLMEKIKPQLVIDAAALHNVDYCEEHPEESWNINVNGTKNVVDACKKFGSKLIFISTDYVFDGKKGNYEETDSVNPLSIYAKHKYEAENIVLSLSKSIVVRTAVLYGSGKPNFVLWVLDSLKSKKEINIVTDQISNPTLANDLADTLINLYFKGQSGLFHTTGSEAVNRYDFTIMIAKVFGLDASLIKPIKTEELGQKAVRPKDCSMNVTKISCVLGRRPLNTSQGLKRMKEEIEWN